MSPFSMGAVEIPLKPHEIKPALKLFSAITTFSEKVYENEMIQEPRDTEELIEDLIHDVRTAFAQVGAELPESAIHCLSLHAEEWGALMPSSEDPERTECGLMICDARSFSNSMISGYIQTLQHIFDLPPISYQYIAMHEDLRPDVAIGHAVEVSREKIFFVSTTDVLNENDKKAQGLHDHIRFGRLEEALEEIASGKHDLDEKDGRALKWAARSDQPKIFKALLDAGVRYDYPELEKLIEGSPEMKSALQARKMEALISIEKTWGVVRRASL